MKTVCAVGPTVKGIDIYHGDPITDINQVVASGNAFAFLKASEGAHMTDSTFHSRWAAMKKAGIIRGAYHFFHPGVDEHAQAASFLKTVGPLEKDDLPCVIDWESTDGVPAVKDAASGLFFLQEVEKATGKIPIIYSGPYFLQALALSKAFSRYPLWVAHYGVRCPLVPSPWFAWTFWQNGDKGPVPGIAGHCDTDLFNGTIDQLKAFVLASNLTHP